MRFFSHQRGAVLLEAAIAFPVLIAILYGMVEFGVAFTVQRKNIQIAGSVADLVSQQMKPTCSQLNDIAGIGATILQPYSATPSSVVVSSILICGQQVLKQCRRCLEQELGKSVRPFGGGENRLQHYKLHLAGEFRRTIRHDQVGCCRRKHPMASPRPSARISQER